MIVGYEGSALARGGIGRLLLAAKPPRFDWVYVASVGTGFSGKDAIFLRKALDSLRTEAPVVPLRGKNFVFVQPTLIAEIEFRGWTNDGNLRHPSYKDFARLRTTQRSLT